MGKHTDLLGFNIINEQDDYQKRQDRLTPAKNPEGFYGDGSLDKLRNLTRDKEEDEVGMAPRYSPFAAKAKDYIETFRKEYRDMSDDGIDEFSVEIINHFLDNTAAQAAAKTFFSKRGL